MMSRTGSTRGGFWGFWKKSVELSARLWTGRVDFRACWGQTNLRATGAARVGGADEKADIERLCLSPYVEKPFDSKVIKSFVPELRSRYVFFVFRDSNVLCIYVMNILCTFRISVSWVWYTSSPFVWRCLILFPSSLLVWGCLYFFFISASLMMSNFFPSSLFDGVLFFLSSLLVWWCLICSFISASLRVSYFFLRPSSFDGVWFFSFISARLIVSYFFPLSLLPWWCLLPIFPSIFSFPSLQAFRCFPDLVFLFFSLFLFSYVSLWAWNIFPDSFSKSWQYNLIICTSISSSFSFFANTFILSMYIRGLIFSCDFVNL